MGLQPEMMTQEALVEATKQPLYTHPDTRCVVTQGKLPARSVSLADESGQMAVRL